mgnify:CR=1 FL=1
MAKVAWTSTVDHNTTAGFRAWGSELSDRLSNTSPLLTKTADTGQIDWATVTVPSTNQSAGFEMYELTDTLSTTAPVFFKITYETGSSASRLEMTIEIGVATDGAGNFVGLTSGTEKRITTPFAPPGDPSVSYLSINEGFVGLVWQFDVMSSSPGKALGGFMISRTSNADGTMSPDGILAFADSGNVSTNITTAKLSARVLPANTIDFLGGWGGANDTSSFLVPSPDPNKTSFDGLAPEAIIGWVGIPEVHPISNIVAVNTREIGIPATFNVAVLGSTPRTYINMGIQLGAFVSGASSTVRANYGMAMLWE